VDRHITAYGGRSDVVLVATGSLEINALQPEKVIKMPSAATDDGSVALKTPRPRAGVAPCGTCCGAYPRRGVFAVSPATWWSSGQPDRRLDQLIASAKRLTRACTPSAIGTGAQPQAQHRVAAAPRTVKTVSLREIPWPSIRCEPSEQRNLLGWWDS